MKIIRSLVFSFFILSFTACQEAPTIQAISYSEALKKCEPVREEHVIKFDGNCVNGAFLPEFSSTDMAGKTVTNQDFKGKMRLLNFWFIECRPCIEEMPDLIALSQKWDPGDFEIVSICLNKREDVEKFLLKNPIPYAILPDSEQLADEVFQNPFGYPANFLIDENGVIVDVFDALKEGNQDYQSLVQLVERQHR
jgi:peroxiredoxin